MCSGPLCCYCCCCCCCFCHTEHLWRLLWCVDLSKLAFPLFTVKSVPPAFSPLSFSISCCYSLSLSLSSQFHKLLWQVTCILFFSFHGSVQILKTYRKLLPSTTNNLWEEPFYVILFSPSLDWRSVREYFAQRCHLRKIDCNSLCLIQRLWSRHFMMAGRLPGRAPFTFSSASE